MARIAGVNIPTNKRVVIALTYIFGIGRSHAKKICESASIPGERRVNELSDQEGMQIREMIDRDYMVEGDLRRDVAKKSNGLVDAECERRLRRRSGVPSRRKGTKTNARAREGKANTVAGMNR